MTIDTNGLDQDLCCGDFPLTRRKIVKPGSIGYNSLEFSYGLIDKDIISQKARPIKLERRTLLAFPICLTIASG